MAGDTEQGLFPAAGENEAAKSEAEQFAEGWRLLMEADLKADLDYFRQNPGRMFHLRRSSLAEFSRIQSPWVLAVRLGPDERGRLPVVLGVREGARPEDYDTEERCMALFEFLTAEKNPSEAAI
jgi:hypothetical protein